MRYSEENRTQLMTSIFFLSTNDFLCQYTTYTLEFAVNTPSPDFVLNSRNKNQQTTKQINIIEYVSTK